MGLESMSLIYVTVRTAENCLHVYFYAGLGVYQSGNERTIRSDLKSGLTLRVQVSTAKS